MFLNESAQTQTEFFKPIKNENRLCDNLIWQKEREFARLKKIQEQRHAKEMLETHWPWGRHHEIKPRGLRNLRMEGLFPQQDYEKAKRTVLGMGRPGGGAPNVNEHGARLCRTKEDPLLRFQWGKDLRKCVDNTLRYRMTKEEQMQYKRELDKLVADKFKQKEQQRMDEVVKDRQLGYTNSKHLDKLSKLEKLEKVERDTEAHSKRIRYHEFKNSTIRPPNQLTRNYKVLYANNAGKNLNVVKPFTIPTSQLSPLLPEDSKVPNGIELVPLMIEKRRQQMGNALSTTDVTKNGYVTGAPKWLLDGQLYLHELSKQMNSKLNQLKETRMKEVESTRRHFNTLDNFWGRPGHGAPRSAIKKTSIDKLLFTGSHHAFPVAVA